MQLAPVSARANAKFHLYSALMMLFMRFNGTLDGLMCGENMAEYLGQDFFIERPFAIVPNLISKKLSANKKAKYTIASFFILLDWTVVGIIGLHLFPHPPRL